MVFPGSSSLMAWSSPAMASTPFTSTLALLPLKLDHSNYFFWHSLVLPAVLAFDLEGFLLGSILCSLQFLQPGEGSSTFGHSSSNGGHQANSGGRGNFNVLITVVKEVVVKEAEAITV
ncbi:hypothetical protein PanWU01x14_030850 [Parasponia andersonii]|uniref:Retrotransposon Copia-like N-terminal domain-containing protein n=1 Tax=Parasponia andersonii TaxID=3476 RepID=A0A2P5DUW1_PARAD|nr:hypothetical protein PanWU01x14_030850 [Parasponia andersonii]